MTTSGCGCKKPSDWSQLGHLSCFNC